MKLYKVGLLFNIILTLALLSVEIKLNYIKIPNNLLAVINKYLFIGSKEFFAISLLVSYIIFYLNNYKKIYLQIYSILSLYIVYIMKVLFARGGNEYNGAFFQEINLGLFPSGHTYLYLISSYLLIRSIEKANNNYNLLKFIKLILYTNFFILITLLIISNYHYISDITASIALFFIYKSIYNKIEKNIYKKQKNNLQFV
jgi:hypothetical protein